MTKIGELFDVRVGYMMSRVVEKDETAESVEVTVLTLSKSGLRKDEKVKKRIKRSFYEKCKNDQLLRENDVVVSLVYPFESMVVTKEMESCIVSNFCAVLRAKKENEINVHYFRELLSSDAFVGTNGAFESCLNKRSRLTAVISLKAFKDLDVSIPNICDQHKAWFELFAVKSRVQVLENLIDAERAYGNAVISGGLESIRQKKSKLTEEYNVLLDKSSRLNDEMGEKE